MSVTKTLTGAGLIACVLPLLVGAAAAHNSDSRLAVEIAPRILAYQASEGDCRSIADSLAVVGDRRGTDAAKLLEAEGRACSEAGDLTAAIAHYSEAIRRSSWRSRTYAWRGELLARLGEHEFALPDFDAAVRLNPRSARYRHLRAISLAAIGRAEAAVADFESLLQLDDPKIVTRLQRHLVKRGYEITVDGEYDSGTRRALVACVTQSCIKL